MPFSCIRSAGQLNSDLRIKLGANLVPFSRLHLSFIGSTPTTPCLMGPDQVGQARIPKLRAWPKRWLAPLKGLVLATRNIFHIAQNFDILWFFLV